MKRYILYVSYSYAYTILRPLQEEIRRRGDDAAWFFENPRDNKYLTTDEKELKSIKEAIKYNPLAVLAPADDIYDFLLGIKVQLFHGLIIKRVNTESHFRIRGYFDLYCTVGNEVTPNFLEQEKKYGFFKVVETGWSKLDDCIPVKKDSNQKPTILYTSTFTKSLTSTSHLYETIEELIQKKNWNWLITLHPKLDKETINIYKQLSKYNNVVFDDSPDNVSLMKKADVMLSDSSSIVSEFLWFDKPVVTFRNNKPGNYLINVEKPENVESAIEEALKRPPELMKNIREYMDWIHPYRDGKSSARVLDAIDDFEKNYKGKLKKKPINLWRKLRKNIWYYHLSSRYKK